MLEETKGSIKEVENIAEVDMTTLCLHTVDEKSEDCDPFYDITKREFVELLDLLAEGTIITFDDGFRSCKEAALESRRRGFRTIVFVVTGWIGKDNMLSEIDLRELKDSGVEVGSHTVSHRSLVDLDTKELRRELFDSYRRIKEITGTARSFSFPYGECNDEVYVAAKMFYDEVYGSGIGGRTGTSRAIKRVSVNKASITSGKELFTRKAGIRTRLRNSSLYIIKSLIGKEEWRRIKTYLYARGVE